MKGEGRKAKGAPITLRPSPLALRPSEKEIIMLTNYLKIAIRNLLRQKVYAVINVFGLAIGLLCCLIILLYVQDELSYDRFHEKADRIYRMVLDLGMPTGTNELASTPSALTPALLQDFPEIEQAVRFYKYFGGASVSHGDKRFQEDSFFFADAAVFDMFTYRFLAGDAKTALQAPFSIVLTESAAQKYFGSANPLGQQLTVNDTLQFRVTGVMEDVPAQSHFRFDFLASFTSWEAMLPGLVNTWAPHMYYTYVLLKPGIPPTELEQKLPAFVDRHTNLSEGWSFTFLLQPLQDIHLQSHRQGELQANGSQAQVYIFLAIAVFVLLLACINFMNLATARSADRAREIGMRKVLGANRSQLIRQFLAESIILSFLSLIVAFVLGEFVLPRFNVIAGKTLALDVYGNWSWMAGLIALIFLVGVLAGSYPAFYLSGFGLEGGSPKSASRSAYLLRKVLVVFQFTISIILISGTGIVNDQLNFMRNQKLGFAPEQILVVPVPSIPERAQKVETLEASLLQHTAILNATASNSVPGRGIILYSFHAEGMPEDEWQTINTLFVDPDFVETYQMEIVAGRDFSGDHTADPTRAFILNEAAVAKLGWTPQEAIGKQFALRRGGGRIIGVVKDFHYVSLHQPVEPLAMIPTPVVYSGAPMYLSLRVRTEDLANTLAFVESTWRALIPNRTFEYFYLDDDFDRQYRADKRFGEVFLSFAALAIFIACLGLFGLSAFAAEKRTKEIGIRKVLGASVSGIIGLLSKDFVKLVLVANLIAWPIAYFAMNKWLQDFAYRIEISWWVFALAGGLALLIALLTVSFQAIKAALANPVDSLRYE
jgi:putative ABC transport system permease protein